MFQYIVGILQKTDIMKQKQRKQANYETVILLFTFNKSCNN